MEAYTPTVQQQKLTEALRPPGHDLSSGPDGWASIRDRLHERGLRWTPQRRTLVDVLARTSGHVTGAELVEQCRALDPTTTPSTVYRTLDVLEGPIRWINVAVWVPLGAASDEPRHAYYVRHGIPDTRLADLPRTVDVSLTPLRGFPIIGRVTGMTWRGKDALPSRERVGVRGLHCEPDVATPSPLANAHRLSREVRG